MTSSPNSQCYGALLGLAVGDALGVPVEFQGRAARRLDPVTTMRAYGTHQQPAGTWSDDTSLTLCLAESLARAGAGAVDVPDLSRRFINWLDNGYWTPHGEVFDVGIATQAAIGRLRAGTEPTQAGGNRELDNGNGALMRILPLVFHPGWQAADSDGRQQLTQLVCSPTHRHARSTLGCYLYLEMAWALLQGATPAEAHKRLYEEVAPKLTPVSAKEMEHFALTLSPKLGLVPEDDIRSSGYVVHTLEAALWCLLRGAEYADTVLTAVNLGDDTDTTGAVAGGLAGLYFGAAQIPANWISTLARRQDIEELSGRLARSLSAEANS